METWTRENELKKLASALCTKPGGSARDLAAAAGISKATFYRVYSSKDHLEEILTERAEEVVEGLFSITEKDITSRNALSEMMRWCCDNREYLMFLCRSALLGDSCVDTCRCSYDDRMRAFFLKGQQRGEFRVDVPAAVMAEIFGGEMAALFEAESRGRIASAMMADYWETIFLFGVEGKGKKESHE